jgi:cytochrome c oxidase cbb3-type subunit 2
MSENGKGLYSKALLFTLVAAVTVLIGTIVTMFYPMLRDEMHPKLESLKPFTALQLAGRDIYQREGCMNCHTQTVRPLKADVLRYGDYSKAGEFYYDRPHLWGSKRTGPDLARLGGKYPDDWHYQHMANPQAFYEKSNMPKYDFLAKNKININQTVAGMKALGFPYTQDDIEQLKTKTEMDAIVAYLQQLGTSVAKKQVILVDANSVEVTSPVAGKSDAVAEGERLYKIECVGCHGKNGEGNIGPAFADSTRGDKDLFLLIANGSEGAMPGYANQFTREQIWALVEYSKSFKKQ